MERPVRAAAPAGSAASAPNATKPDASASRGAGNANRRHLNSRSTHQLPVCAPRGWSLCEIHACGRIGVVAQWWFWCSASGARYHLGLCRRPKRASRSRRHRLPRDSPADAKSARDSKQLDRLSALQSSCKSITAGPGLHGPCQACELAPASVPQLARTAPALGRPARTRYCEGAAPRPHSVARPGRPRIRRDPNPRFATIPAWRNNRTGMSCGSKTPFGQSQKGQGATHRQRPPHRAPHQRGRDVARRGRRHRRVLRCPGQWNRRRPRRLLHRQLHSSPSGQSATGHASAAGSGTRSKPAASTGAATTPTTSARAGAVATPARDGAPPVQPANPQRIRARELRRPGFPLQRLPHCPPLPSAPPPKKSLSVAPSAAASIAPGAARRSPRRAASHSAFSAAATPVQAPLKAVPVVPSLPGLFRGTARSTTW